MKKLSNKVLVIVLLVLVCGFALSRLFRAPALEGSVRQTLVKVDTAAVTDMTLHTALHPDEEVKFHKEAGQWTVSRGKESHSTDRGMVNTMLRSIAEIKPERMISHKKEKWDDFKVGEKGTHLVAYAGSEKVADFIIGKTGFVPSTEGTFGRGFTYFRLSNEEDVFSIDGYLEATFSRKFDDWRDKTLLRLRKEDVVRITFDYPLDSGYVAEKKDSTWHAGGTALVPSSVMEYLGRIANQRINAFADGFAAPAKPDITIQYDGVAGSLAKVEFWKQADKWIMTSSVQPGVFFTNPDNIIVRAMMISKKKLATK